MEHATSDASTTPDEEHHPERVTTEKRPWHRPTLTQIPVTHTMFASGPSNDGDGFQPA